MDTVQVWHWFAFSGFVALMLFLDLTVIHRKSHEPTLKESAGWTIFWIVLALIFNVLIWFWLGRSAGLEFLTGYLIEKSLSMDNIFVFAVIFSFFRVPLKYQYRVLFWGILGAVVMRLVFILAGTALIERFEWVVPIFGIFLIWTAVKLAMHSEAEVHPENNILMRLARRVFPVAKGEHGSHFFVIEDGRKCVTKLFLVLLVVESTDVMFAVDSVPAILAVVNRNTDYYSFIVFTSNVFAILGLRALYFLLAGVMDMFRYLHFGLAAVLGFVGLKMVGEYAAHQFHLFPWVEADEHLVPPAASLVIVVSLLGISIAASLMAQKRETGRLVEDPEPPKPSGPIKIPDTESDEVAH